MAKDFKAAPGSEMGGPRSAAPAKKRRLNPMFIGIMIGLLLGVGLALGLAIWVNRANNPFIEKSRPVDALPTISVKPPTATGTGMAPATGAPLITKGEAEKPRFEFYQILPGEKGEKGDRHHAGDKVVKSEKPTKPEPVISAPLSRPTEPPSSIAATAKPPAKPDVKPASGDIFHLQAGAYQSTTDAENMKAKIAFAGFEATVRPVNLPDKGTLYRVRLGPFKSLDEVNRIKAALSQGGISAAVVKGSD